MSTCTAASAKHLYSEPKKQVCERITQNVNSFASIANQVTQKPKEMLHQTIQNFVNMEDSIDRSEKNLQKISLLEEHLTTHLDSIEKMSNSLENVKEQAQAMRR